MIETFEPFRELYLCPEPRFVLAGLAIGATEDSPGEVAPAATKRDGQHDFDFDFGTWKTHVSRLASPNWLSYLGGI